MRILVTGATGFVGKAIVAELRREKFDVVCLGSLKNENSDDLPYFQRADVEDLERWAREQQG